MHTRRSLRQAEDCAQHEKNPERDIFGRERFACAAPTPASPGCACTPRVAASAGRLRLFTLAFRVPPPLRREEKQSRGGVGSFLSVTKALYVGFGAATER